MNEEKRADSSEWVSEENNHKLFISHNSITDLISQIAASTSE